jgi:hypothetical protein
MIFVGEIIRFENQITQENIWDSIYGRKIKLHTAYFVEENHHSSLSRRLGD